ncbi:hypothetical protein F5877DRAFT_81960 [Lentinula edodes]|nr:hypothetical protein F5877DRAFT_81960 [Lentinula edodes]
MSMVLPPNYFPTPSPPRYSYLLPEGEETVEFTPRGNAPTNVLVNITKTCSFLTIILKDQNPAEECPTYGRGSTIHGEIGLRSSASVLSVSIKLKGRLRVSISDSGSATIPVVSESAVLWSRDSAHKDLCPSVLPFSIAFPTTFKHGDRVRSIPPSFSEAYYQLPAISAQCSYILKVTIHNSSKMTFWKPSRSYSLWLNYRPRTRPQRPVFHLDRFLATLKQIPEDWLELESTMRIRRTDSPDLKPISCRFFFPSVGAFGLSDTIPFHIQISSSLASLRLLLSPEIPNSGTERPSVRVFISRQTMVEVNTRKCWRTATLVEGRVRAIAPPIYTTAVEGADTYVDWEGEVRVEKDMVQYGGFNIGTVIVKDYIVFAITPPNPRSCPLLAHQHSVPIKLVTDVWTDGSTSHPLDT